MCVSQLALSQQLWQLGDVARYAPSLIKRQPLSGLSIALVGAAIHVSDGLLISVYNFEARVYGSTVHGRGNRLIPWRL